MAEYDSQRPVPNEPRRPEPGPGKPQANFLVAYLEAMVTRGYLKPVEPEANRGRGRPVEKYRVNPHIFV